MWFEVFPPALHSSAAYCDLSEVIINPSSACAQSFSCQVTLRVNLKPQTLPAFFVFLCDKKCKLNIFNKSEFPLSIILGSEREEGFIT